MSGAPLLMTENSSSLADVYLLRSGRSIWEYMDGGGGGSGPQGFGGGHRDKRMILAGKGYQRIHGDPRPCFLMRQKGRELVLVSSALIQKTENVFKLFSY